MILLNPNCAPTKNNNDKLIVSVLMVTYPGEALENESYEIDLYVTDPKSDNFVEFPNYTKYTGNADTKNYKEYVPPDSEVFGSVRGEWLPPGWGAYVLASGIDVTEYTSFRSPYDPYGCFCTSAKFLTYSFMPRSSGEADGGDVYLYVVPTENPSKVAIVRVGYAVRYAL